MIHTYWNIRTAAAILSLAFAPNPLPAKPHGKASGPASQRKVVLMDFSRAGVPEVLPGPTIGAEDQPIADVAQQMASAFTNASPPADLSVPAHQQPSLTASSLSNPFLTRAVATMPTLPVPAYNAGGSCAAPEYQPDYSHGRAAEERRRLIFPLVHQAACEQGLPIGLFDALIMQESRYNHMAISPKGALGLAQLMPGTARQLGANPYAVIENLRGGARYLRQQLDRFGRYDLALAAYNAGPGRVARLGRVPAITETTDYVRRISMSWTGNTQRLASTDPIVARRAVMIFMPYYARAAKTD